MILVEMVDETKYTEGGLEEAIGIVEDLLRRENARLRGKRVGD